MEGERNSLSSSVSVCGVSYSHGYKMKSATNLCWNLGGNYKQLTFFIALPDKSPQHSGLYYEVYGDNKLIKQVKFEKQTPPKDFVIDITGVQILKIITPGGSWGEAVILNPQVK